MNRVEVSAPPLWSATRHSIAGISFDLIDYPTLLAAILSRPRERPAMVTLANPHTVMMCHRSDVVRSVIERSDWVLPDGVGVILAARLSGIPHCGRLPGPVLLLRLCSDGRYGNLRHYFYGGRDGVAAALAHRLLHSLPGLEVAGYREPPFFEWEYEAEDQECRHINASHPDIVWVGLGSPKQEAWIVRNIEKLEARAVIGIGAAFDFHGGRIPWAPGWVRRCGLEWLHRLVQEPSRLWRRNLDSPRFLLRAVRERL